MNTIDVINKTPKENESLILKKSNRNLFIEKLLIVWSIFLLQLSPFGFVQLFSVEVQFWCYTIIGILFSLYVLGYILIFGNSSTDRYVNDTQYKELQTFAAKNKKVGKYLFLANISGRPVYLAEYKELIKMKGLCFIY